MSLETELCTGNEYIQVNFLNLTFLIKIICNEHT